MTLLTAVMKPFSLRLLLIAGMASTLSVSATALSSNSPVAAAANPFVHNTPSVSCVTYFDNSWTMTGRVIAPASPEMEALGYYGLTISWQPQLNMWSSKKQKWFLEMLGPELKGNTEQSLPSYAGFTITRPDPAYYEVSIRYRWYVGSTVVFDSAWAGTHTSFYYRYRDGGYLDIYKNEAGAWCKI